MEPIVIVHGGAGDITEARVPGKITGVKKSVYEGYSKLQNGGNVLDAVEAAVCSMEKDENFNAGYGSVLTIEGNVELEASIMNGKDLKAGCVTLLKGILHPISVARRIMEKTRHIYLGGIGAMDFAKCEGFCVLPEGALTTENAKKALEEFKKKQEKCEDVTFARTELDQQQEKKEIITKEHGEPGTVGAVAIDSNGNIAVATSTGGITGKLPGRIGDTPVLGSGTYADNEIGGVSTTGHGETIMRYNLAQRILQKIVCEKQNAQTATESVINEMTKRCKGTAGAITIDKNGNIGIHFSSKRMAWAYIKGNELHYGINHGEDFVEKAF